MNNSGRARLPYERKDDIRILRIWRVHYLPHLQLTSLWTHNTTTLHILTRLTRAYPYHVRNRDFRPCPRSTSAGDFWPPILLRGRFHYKAVQLLQETIGQIA